MPNKHEIQKDFYNKQKEWKKTLEVEIKQKNLKSVLFDEEIYPEFKDDTQIRSYYREVE